MLNAKTITDLSPLALILAVGGMLLLESLAPLVPLLPGKQRAHHAFRNIGLALCTSLFAVGGSIFLVAISVWAAERQVGFLHHIEAPFVVRFFVALIGIDFFEWVRHRLHHRIPLLWRLHRVHHTDPHVDATTAVRGHPLESVLAYSYFGVIVLALGIDPLALACRSLIAAMALAWHHADFRLPPKVDQLISLITPTPRTHRLHHARDVLFTDSNYGTLFTWWDRLFGTFTEGNSRPPGQTGLNGFDEAHTQSVLYLLKSPLRNMKSETVSR